MVDTSKIQMRLDSHGEQIAVLRMEMNEVKNSMKEQTVVLREIRDGQISANTSAKIWRWIVVVLLPALAATAAALAGIFS